MATHSIKASLTFLLGNCIFLLIQAKQCPPLDILSPCKCNSRTFQGTKVICRGVDDGDTLYKEIQKLRSYRIDNLHLVELNLPYLPAGLFEGLSVRRLHFESSQLDNLYSIKSSKATAFEGLETSLEEIHVKDTNTPSNWYWPDMKQFKKLKVFSFSNSPLNFVGHNFAEIGGGSVTQITIRNSKVDRIHPQAFPEMTNLISAEFEGNRLVYLTRTMFPNPALDLAILSFRNNRLSSVDENIFQNMPELKFLDFSGNQFKHFNSKAFVPVASQLITLFLADNPYECECELRPLKIIMETKSFSVSDLNNVTCINEGQFKKTKLKDIDFSSLCSK